jgi:two-component system chemotaxis response regulator CheY
MNQARILIVDDDRLMLTLLAGVLRHEGYLHVQRAATGKEAIAKFLQTRPDIVFLDIEMPDFSGIETLNAIKEFGVVTQVVMVTATPTAQNVKAAQEGGAAGFLVKPVSPAKVANAVQACIERARKEEGGVELFVCD